ncbi:MAG: hypothetical protein H0T85_00470 [Geodermatophilaceae bacterium]|nr:hypothetical protein [Geodermatophilaceae bacterium]
MSEHEPRPHPLLPVLLDAAAGRFPRVDGGVDLLPPLPGRLAAVVSMTGHAFIATHRAAAAFTDLVPDGYGRSLLPAVLHRLAGDGGDVGVLDVTLVHPGRGGGAQLLRRRVDLDGHPRVQHARALRRGVVVYADERAVLTLARGLAGRTELSIEAFPGQSGARRSIDDALGLVDAGTPVFAAVAPGNARSLRAFLAVGFTVLGSEVIIRPGAADTMLPGQRVGGSGS